MLKQASILDFQQQLELQRFEMEQNRKALEGHQQHVNPHHTTQHTSSTKTTSAPTPADHRTTSASQRHTGTPTPAERTHTRPNGWPCRLCANATRTFCLFQKLSFVWTWDSLPLSCCQFICFIAKNNSMVFFMCGVFVVAKRSGAVEENSGAEQGKL